MGTRCLHGIQIAAFVAVMLLWSPILARGATPPPSPTVSSGSNDVASPERSRVDNLMTLSDNGSDAGIYFKQQGESQGHVSPATASIARPAPVPLCGYFALSSEELASPGVWAGALEANTGNLVPGSFPVAAIAASQAAVPDD